MSKIDEIRELIMKDRKKQLDFQRRNFPCIKER